MIAEKVGSIHVERINIRIRLIIMPVSKIESQQKDGVEQNIMERIGILGGTFNPIHNSHLIIAEKVRKEFCLDTIIFLPAGKPPHKPCCIIENKEERYAMLLLATNRNLHFFVSRIEIDREGCTYTVDTLQELHGLYQMEHQFFYIIGADTLLEIATWKNIVDVFRQTEIICVYRPGVDKECVQQQLKLIRSKYQKDIILAPIHGLNISSTDIREKINKNESIRKYVPSDVWWYIKKHNLYHEYKIK